MVSVGALLTAAPAPAAENAQWQGVTQNWLNSVNWNTGTVPGASSDVIIDNLKPAGSGAVLPKGTATVHQVAIGAPHEGRLTVKQGGRLTATGGFIVGNTPDSSGTLNLRGAATSVNVGGGFLLGRTGDGVLNITHGAALTTSGAQLANFNGYVFNKSTGKYIHVSNPATAHVLIQGNSSIWNNSGDFVAGDGGRAEITLADGGTLSANGGKGTVRAGWAAVSQAKGFINIGAAAGDAAAAPGVLDAALLAYGDYGRDATGAQKGGGSLVFNHTASNYVFAPRISGHVNISFLSGTTTLTADGSSAASANVDQGANVVLDGGSLNLATGGGPLTVGDTGDGTLTLTHGAKLRLGGGQPLEVAKGADSTATLNIGAAAGAAPTAPGTLNMSASTQPWLQFGDGAGTLVFNHTGDAYEFGTRLQGNGQLRQLAGTTILTTNSSSTASREGFSGPTTVSGGTLLVNNKNGSGTGSGAVSVQSGGALGGTGTIAGSVTVKDGALQGEQGQTLTMGSLALNSNSNVNVSLGVPGNTTGLFNVTGGLTLDGTLNVTDDGGLGVGIYRLMDYSGTLTDNGLAIGATPDGVTTAANLTVQTATANQVNLVSTAGQTLYFWDGGDSSSTTDWYDSVVDGGDGTWKGGVDSWTSSDGNANGDMATPGFAVFGSAVGIVHVDNSAGNAAVTGMQFATDGYILSGDPIELAGTNGKSVIRVGDGTDAGAGYSAFIGNSLTGTSALYKTGRGKLVLTSPSTGNSYSGGTVIEEGTLAVSYNGNLGAAGTTVTLAGGTLEVDDGFASNRPVILEDGAREGGIAVDGSDSATLSGKLSGDGALAKRGTGTLTLTGTDNAYGGNLIYAGTLTGSAGSISGDIANAATVVFDQANDGSFSSDITDLDGTAGAMTKRGAGTLTLTGTDDLDWTIEAGGLAATAGLFNGDVSISADTSMTFNQAVDGDYAGVLSGTGRFVKAGGGLVQLTGDSSNFAGETSVDQGTLAVNGKLGGTLNVKQGARLQGTGSVGDTSVAGTVAPGNSIGTLHVNGDITLDSTATYEVEVDPSGASDQIATSGTATINGGTVHVIKAPGTYTPGSRWTIIEAGGGVTGAFDGLTQDMPFVDLALAYDPGNVYLDVTRNDVSFCDVAGTFNECASAGGVESTGAGDPVYDAVVALPDAETARYAFDQLSGESYASAQSALLDDSRYLRSAVSDRLRVGCAGTPRPTKTGANRRQRTCAGTVWTRSFGAWGHQDGDGNAARLDHNIHGIFIGADTLVGDAWRLGFVGGYSHATSNVNPRASSDDSDSYQLGLYTGTHWGRLGFHAGAAYAWNEIDSERSIRFPGFTDATKANYTAHTAQVFTELGYDLDFGRSALTPFARAAYVHLDTDSFDESGGAAALHDSGKTNAIGVSTLGVRLSSVLNRTDTSTIRAHGLMGWRHTYGDVTPEADLAFDGGNRFTVAGVPLARDALALEAGLDADVNPRLSVGASYVGQFGNGTEINGFKVNVIRRF